MSNLLPNGFVDLVFDEAKENYKNTNQALELFFASGYNLIKTPIVEFAGATNSINSFFTSDDIS